MRRPTRGGILHTDELTYGGAAPQDEPCVAGGVFESYRRLSAGLVRGLPLLTHCTTATTARMVLCFAPEALQSDHHPRVAA